MEEQGDMCMRVMKSVAMVIIVVLAVSNTVALAAPLKLGITWPGESNQAIKIEEAFRAKIMELVPDVDLELQTVPDVEAMSELIARFEREKDGMIVMRSNGSQWLIAHPPVIPTFIAGVNHPGLLGVVKNLEAPEGNITGVTYYVPVEKQFDIFQAILPNLDSVLLLLQEGHASTPLDRTATQTVCKQLGITYYEQVCATEAESIAAVEAYRDKVSAVIIGANLLNDYAANIVKAAGHTPVFSFLVIAVNAGALGGFVADETIMGHLLAESVVEVLVNGKIINEVPIKMDPDPKFVLNVSTAEKLGINIPYNILQAATIVE
ncbi:ABC superfamily ATP binding cassette transporter, binding protein [Candidatus Vecturithrix granuli]|uniref:ABC superfamily ATP binding cassette transporter, binding protein n=1 Tax=Vecturithrix granuli TaxID=1499967 RepID=A0A081C0L7_VECG1|nr:ABC superfamily ATP binding cassette transporter, binding protein [Candidatus Vecturithrix granuli]